MTNKKYYTVIIRLKSGIERYGCRHLFVTQEDANKCIIFLQDASPLMLSGVNKEDSIDKIYVREATTQDALNARDEIPQHGDTAAML